MKAIISSTGNKLESSLDQRFGRAAYFIFVDTESADIEVIDNGAAASAGGAGITSAQTVIDKGADAVITGNVGPNAMKVLKTAGIGMFKGVPSSVKENVEKFRQGILDEIDSSVPQHYGMGLKGEDK